MQTDHLCTILRKMLSKSSRLNYNRCHNIVVISFHIIVTLMVLLWDLWDNADRDFPRGILWCQNQFVQFITGKMFSIHRTFIGHGLCITLGTSVQECGQANREINYSPKLDVEYVMSTNSSIHTALVCTDGLIMWNNLQSISFYVDISEQPLWNNALLKCQRYWLP